MTPEMLAKARRNVAAYKERRGLDNVEFRLGEIEHLPAADNSVDVILSNCVINLSPDKPQVYREAFRVLKKGGRVAVADVVATAEMPESVKKDMALYTGCVAGASLIGDLERMLRETGFQDVRVAPKDTSKKFIKEWAEGRRIEEFVVSAVIEARKP
jgi:ubiquinone/menaquinone biosynthesis C-methylase UbiE